MKLLLILVAISCSYTKSNAYQEHQHVYSPPARQAQVPMTDSESVMNEVPLTTREFWMRRAVQALSELVSPCPFEAFGSVIVNHTDTTGLGELICIGANNIASGNPTLHGEIAAINNCSSILTDPSGLYKLSGAQAADAWSALSLYTTAEPCPMCAAAIRWGGFREIIIGTSSASLIEKGWKQFSITTREVICRSHDLPHIPELIEDVLTNETDPLFSWQYHSDVLCPLGCHRIKGGCHPSKD